MSVETKEVVQNLIYYYSRHGIENFVKGDDERLKDFVIEDFTKLLHLLRPIVFEAAND